MKHHGLLSAAIVAALTASQAHAAVLYSWENSTEGFASTNVTGYSTTIGVTHAIYSIHRDVPASSGWTSWTDANAYAEIDTMKANDRISVDVTLPATAPAIPGGAGINVWFNLNISSTHFPGAGADRNAADVAVDGSGRIRITAPGTYTLSWDYDPARFAAVTSSVPGAWAEIRIVTSATGANWAGAGITSFPLYFDNFRAVPEPASLALLGLGALCLATRRRG